MSTMRKTKGSGVMPAVMTFWNADESFNQKETERYIQWVLDCGAHSLSVTGSTGENISMSDDEPRPRCPRQCHHHPCAVCGGADHPQYPRK